MPLSKVYLPYCKSSNTGNHTTYDDTAYSWNKCSQSSPFNTSRFFFYGQAGSGAGPVKETEYSRADRGFYGPAVGGKKVEQYGEIGKLSQMAGL